MHTLLHTPTMYAHCPPLFSIYIPGGRRQRRESGSDAGVTEQNKTADFRQELLRLHLMGFL